MDNLTHSLVGLFLARVGFKYATPRGTAILVLAANAPDFDAVSWFGPRSVYIMWHRNFTHSLLAIPVMALLSIALVRVIGRQPIRWLPAWLIAILGVSSHVILDLTNVYGVRLLLPFSGRWFHWDITSVIDLTIWTILLLGVAAPMLIRLVGSEIGEKRPEAGNAGWAFTALFLLCALDFSRGFLHDRAVALIDTQHYNGLAPRRAGAFPTGNPLLWRGMVELSNAYVEIPIDLREDIHLTDADYYYKAERTPAVEAALQTKPFQRFLQFVQYPLWVTEPAPDIDHGTRVTLLDLRFGSPRAIGFASTALVNAYNQVLDAGFGMGAIRPR